MLSPITVTAEQLAAMSHEPIVTKDKADKATKPNNEATAKPKAAQAKGSKWKNPKGSGTVPAPRGGHAAAAACDGKSMVMFGGADREPTPYNVPLVTTLKLDSPSKSESPNLAYLYAATI